MLLPNEPLSGSALIEQTFRPEHVPDVRLFRRLKTTADATLRTMLDEGDERPEKERRAERRGASRLYANVRVNADLLCQQVQQRTVEAIVKLPRVLVAHDTSEFDEHGRHEPADAGPLRANSSCGYLLHHGVVLDPDNDARLGILYMDAWTRPYPAGTRPEGKVRVRREWDNEDQKWTWGMNKAHKALERGGFKGHVRHLADHEGSSYATLANAVHHKRDYVTRTRVDRNIAEGSGKLFDYLLEQPMAARWSLTVEEDPKSGERGAQRRRRTATVEMRYASVTLLPSNSYRRRRYREGLRLSAVYVYEPEPPPGAEPLSWMLLATKRVKTKRDAEEVVYDYKDRWGVEDINKVIKSGCHAELAVVPDLAAFKRLMAVVWPIACHIVRWTYAARVTPLEPAAPHVGDEALEALKLASRYHGLSLPRRPWTIGDVISHLAQMGGYEPRKDQPPGWKVIWRGWRVFNNFWDHQRFIHDHKPPSASDKQHPSQRLRRVLPPAREAENTA